MATLYKMLVALNGCQGPKWYQAGDSSMKPGYLCMEDDADEVKVCSTSGTPIGVVGTKAQDDINTAFTAGERVPVYLLGSGIECYVLHDGSSAEAVKKGSRLQSSSTTAGAVRLKPAYTSKSATYAASEFTERGDTDNFVIGKATQTVTITSGTTQFIKCLLE